MPIIVSGEIDTETELRLTATAKRANRTLSATVSRAVEVFTDVPEDVSSLVHDLRSDCELELLQKLQKDMSAAAAKFRFLKAFRSVVQSTPLGEFEPLEHEDELLRQASDMISKMRNQRVGPSEGE